jgi:hypothetical protein
MRRRPDVRRAAARFAAAMAILLAVSFYAAWLRAGSLGVGWYRDDGVYVIAAASLARGEGPRLAFLPGAPLETKYPLAWPALLAGVIALSGTDGPALTSPLVVAPNALLLPLALLAFAILLRRRWDLPAVAVFLLVLALALNPAVLELARFPLSETLYLALTLGAVALADAPARKPSRARELLAAVLAVAALHTRWAGVTLVVALLAAFAMRRRWRAFAATLALTLASLGAWGLYLRHAAAVDAAAHAEPLFAYDLGYGGDLPADAAGLMRAIVRDAPPAAYFSASIALGRALPTRLLDATAAGGPALPLAALVLGFVALLGAGAWARARAAPIGLESARVRGAGPPVPALERAETWYVPLALGVVLLWSEETWRLLVPLAPWLIALPVLAAARLPRHGRAAAACLAGAFLLFALSGWRQNVPRKHHFRAGDLVVETRSLDRAIDAVRALPTKARVGTPMAPLVHLRTGRICVDSWTGPRVIGPLMKGKDLRTFYLTGGEPDLERAWEAVGRALAAYPRHGVHYAFSRRFPAEDFFLIVVQSLRGSRPLHQSEEYALYALPLAPP